ncbi:hypothetical protein ACHAWF_010335 [Thalassiosira exigua]
MSAKLYYYQATGRGHAIRLALAASNIEFEDVYATFPPSEEQKAAWRKIGGNSTTNVPMLQMPDGTVYTQSQAVMRAVGRMGGLMPADDASLYRTDKLMCDADDLRSASYKCFKFWGAPQSACDEFIATVLPNHLGNLERQLKEPGTKYFVGDSLTLADLACYDAVVNFGSNRHPPALDTFPELKAWKERVEAHEGINKYLASDAYADMMKFGPETLGK